VEPQTLNHYLPLVDSNPSAKLLSEPEIAVQMVAPLWHEIPRGATRKDGEHSELISHVSVHRGTARQVLQQGLCHEATYCL
jgi:hypothetical protein